jgi:hypothetical protein
MFSVGLTPFTKRIKSPAFMPACAAEVSAPMDVCHVESGGNRAARIGGECEAQVEMQEHGAWNAVRMLRTKEPFVMMNLPEI